MTRLTSFAFVALILASACGRQEPPPDPGPIEPRLLAHRWEGSVLRVDELPSAELEVSTLSGSIVVAHTGWPYGTRILVGSEVLEGRALLERPDLVPLFGEVSLSGLEDPEGSPWRRSLPIRIEPGEEWLPIEVESPPVELTQLAALRAIGAAMREEGAHPNGFLFEGEPEGDRRDTALVDWAVSEDADRRIFGDGALAREIDWVIRERREPTGESQICGGYSNPGTPGTTDVRITLNESVLVVRDRRTGAEVARERFPASRRCPRMAYVEGGSTGSDLRPMQRWVERWVDENAD